MGLLFFRWFAADAPRAYVGYIAAVFHALANYFSFTQLALTLFDPWRHDAVTLTRLPLVYWGQAIARNVTSRCIGFFVRMSVLIAGGFVVSVFAVGGAIFIIAWYLLPFLLALSIIFGVQLIGSTYV